MGWTSVPTGCWFPQHYQCERPYGCERALHGHRFKSWRWRPDDRQPTGDPRLPCHRWSDRWLGQCWPSRSIQCTATQKPDQSTNYLRESEQRSCYHELRFTEWCAQPCSVCLLQFTLGQCRLGHQTPSPPLQRAPEALLQPGSTRVEPKLLFKTDAWPTMRPDISKKSRFRRFRLLWSVPALRVALNMTRWFIRGQVVSVTLSV